MSKEAMKLALEIAIDYMNERLEDHDCKYQRHPATEAERINILADIETVKEALAKQEKGEPVAWQSVSTEMLKFLNGEAPLDGVWFGEDHPIEKGAYWWRKRLNTTPQQRKPLTDEQTNKAAMKLAECMDYPWTHMPDEGRQEMRNHAKAVIEAAFKE